MLLFVRYEFIIHKQRTTNWLPFAWVTVRPEVVYICRSGSVPIHPDRPPISVRARIGSNSSNWLATERIFLSLDGFFINIVTLISYYYMGDYRSDAVSYMYHASSRPPPCHTWKPAAAVEAGWSLWWQSDSWRCWRRPRLCPERFQRCWLWNWAANLNGT